MPEINIGLYPDVGGSWFLRRTPGRTGLFLALTAAPLNAADAIFCGLADVLVPQDAQGAVLEAMAAASWTRRADGRPRRRSRGCWRRPARAPSCRRRSVREHFDTINALMAGDDLLAIAEAPARAAERRPVAADGRRRPSPRARPARPRCRFALWQRVPRMSLAEVFRLEYWASLGFCAHADFAEGIRALLIDKDRNPRWNPPTLDEITPAFIDDHLRPRGEMPPELAPLA